MCMTTTTKTEAQAMRETERDGAGRFVKNPCDYCQKGAPMNGPSDERCNTTPGGFGITLHNRCADKLAKLSDEDYVALGAFIHNLLDW